MVDVFVLTFFVVVSIVCAVLAWLGSEVIEPALKRRRALQAEKDEYDRELRKVTLEQNKVMLEQGFAELQRHKARLEAGLDDLHSE